MPSFNAINYSLRPSKSIQRQLVFNGVRDLQEQLHLERLIYMGFGSIWFTDFIMAHKLLSIDDMVSIESHEVGYRRACYNSPFATVRVFQGKSSDVLPTLYEDELIKGRSWLVWMDYDYPLEETIRDDLRSLIENAPANSIVLVTFNGLGRKYAKPQEIPVRLRQILGSVVPDTLSKDDCQNDKIQQTLARLSMDYMKSVAADLSRPGGFVPAFEFIYADGAPMVTVGGILPTKGAARVAADFVARPEWPCRPALPIVAPHLTIREVAALQALLPSSQKLTRAAVQQLGFDLEDDQIAVFERYYRHYPAFAQIIS